ncbi:MAG: hypothetical protein JXB45_06370, partial [Candidatus Krumholzibacteriota bacterium]|nr:hypothetical protein [Candidatus Krumholzibacteriota bacterium]
MEVTNPQSESILNRRKSILLALFIAVVAILLGRLFSLQVIRHEHYSRLALSNRIQRERILAPRGLIRARDGSKLVVNVPVYQINILPREVRNDWEKLTLACRWLEIDEEKLLANLSEWKERYPDGREMPVVPAAAKHQISSLMENRALFPFFRLVM